jgi:hypothetical protein
MSVATVTGAQLGVACNTKAPAMRPTDLYLDGTMSTWGDRPIRKHEAPPRRLVRSHKRRAVAGIVTQVTVLAIGLLMAVTLR